MHRGLAKVLLEIMRRLNFFGKEGTDSEFCQGGVVIPREAVGPSICFGTRQNIYFLCKNEARKGIFLVLFSRAKQKLNKIKILPIIC